MKIEFHANDYMDIFFRKQNNNVFLELGKIYKKDDDELVSLNNVKTIKNIELADLFLLLGGYNINKNIENEIVNYFNHAEAFIRIKKFADSKIIYSFLKCSDETEIASSTDFLNLIFKEVYDKENNASL